MDLFHDLGVGEDVTHCLQGLDQEFQQYARLYTFILRLRLSDPGRIRPEERPGIRRAAAGGELAWGLHNRHRLSGGSVI